MNIVVVLSGKLKIEEKIISGKIYREEKVISGNISHEDHIISGNIKSDIINYYDEEYEFTPTQEEQIINISQRTAREDIVVKPIPHNYGKIEWNGSYLYIS